jgi:hypothetical protein
MPFIVYPEGRVGATGHNSATIDFGLKDHWVEKKA